MRVFIGIARRGFGRTYEFTFSRVFYGDRLESLEDAYRLWEASMKRYGHDLAPVLLESRSGSDQWKRYGA